MANKRTPSQLDQSPLADMDTGEPTIDELLENATDEQLERIENGEDPEKVLRGE